MTDQPRDPGDEPEDPSTEQEQGVEEPATEGDRTDPRTGQNDGGARSGDRYSGTES